MPSKRQRPGSPARLHKLKTDRLCLKEATPGDYSRIHGIFASNPDFLSLRRDLAHSPSGYDLESVARYCETAMFDAARHLLIAVDKSIQEPVGLIDFVEVSPSDGHPWLGLILIDGARHRQGFATEMVRAVCRHLKSKGKGTVRVAVLEENQTGREFLHAFGFSAFEQAPVMPSPDSGQAILMEKRL